MAVRIERSKTILISVPDHLLEEVDFIVASENSSRNEFIRQAMKTALGDRHKHQLLEEMQRGYAEMGIINLNYAIEAFQAEEDASLLLGQQASGV